MATTENVQPQGEKIRKALRWVGETIQDCPDKKRERVIKEAEIRFDLSPAECEFLDNNFS
ncbi:MAG: hypothetical protein ABFQ82_06050 [Thermodesulfobacteriota bacterium]